MKKKHPTERWNYCNATKEEKRELRECYNELIALGATHEQIQKLFMCGWRAGEEDQAYSDSLYDV